MLGWFKRDRCAKDVERQRKVEESQSALLEAAITTADVAKLVTTRLKQRLDDSLKQFEVTAAIINDALLIAALDGTIEAMNPAAERMFRRSAGETENLMALFAAADTGGGAVPPAEIKTIDDLWMHLGDVISPDLVGVRSDGRRFDISVTTSRLDRCSGESVNLIVVREHTGRQDAERFRSLFEHSFDAFAVVHDGTLMATNTSFARMFGYDTPEDAMAAVPLLSHGTINVLTTGDVPTSFMADGHHRDGQTIEVIMAATSMMWSGGSAWLVTAKDVSELRRLETMTAPRRDNMVDMIVCFGADFRITFANPVFAEFQGTTVEHLLGSDIRLCVPPSDRANFIAEVEGLDASSPSARSRLQFNAEDGSPRLHDWITHAAFGRDGRVIEYQRIGRDISDLIPST